MTNSGVVALGGDIMGPAIIYIFLLVKQNAWESRLWDVALIHIWIAYV